MERLQQSDSASNNQQKTNQTDEQTTNSQEESLENVPSDSKTGSLKNHLSYKSKRIFECRCLLLKIVITADLIWSSFTVKLIKGHGMVKPLPSHEKLIYRKIYEKFYFVLNKRGDFKLD